MIRNNIFALSKIEELLEKLNIFESTETGSFNVTLIIISIATILFLGFLMTRLTKLLKLPNVTAYILMGILIGPSVLNIIPTKIISGMEFLSDIALAFIAFQAGEYFKLKEVKKTGFKVLIITLFECLLTFGLVFLIMAFVLRIKPSFALVVSTLASATAPASTMMTIKQTKAKGEYVNYLLEVIVFDNIFTLILYSIAINIAISIESGTALSFTTIGWPILKTVICMVIGIGFGFLLRLLLPKKRTKDNRLIIVIAVLFLFCGVSALLNESPLLGCMTIGMVYTNLMDENDKLFKQLAYFSPPIMLLFFMRSGMNFNLSSFSGSTTISVVPMIVIVLIYFVLRVIGKYGGSYVGSLITKSSKPIRNYLGMGLIPMAGVAIGLAQMGSRQFESAGFMELGSSLNTIILSVSILYEIVGPVSAKLGLYLSKSYSNDLDTLVPVETLDGRSEVDKLIKQIQEIQKTIPKVEVNEAEQAFTEAAEEYDGGYSNLRGFLRKR